MKLVHCLSIKLLLTFIWIINGQLTKEGLITLLGPECNQPSVTLHVFSAKPNPIWRVSMKQTTSLKILARSILKDYDKRILVAKETKRVMGYQGFTVTCSADKQIFVHGVAPLEIQLLETGRSSLSPTIIRHVSEHVGSIISLTNHTILTRVNCDRVPIKGSDKVPTYNPLTENGGCFIKKQSKNNCYAYGNSIVTNTFPQPGRYNGKYLSTITCESVRQAVLLDGLVYYGTKLPVGHPKKGHFVALLIWPNVDYHWARKDANGYWSHKPGAGPISNKDNTGSRILNPSKSNLSPWKLFCGYYIAQPSQVNIS